MSPNVTASLRIVARCLKLEHMVMECIGGIDHLAHPEAAQQAALFER
ncbi:MAG: hypothetical protein JNN08_10750 [Bryobacterales bacterium]|nr:hypothetical protein [Bryobacterales bacterium]